MRRARFLSATIVMAALLLSSVSATHPQTADDGCEYFAETGHYVCDEFLEFHETRGGLETFGYPLTEAFDDPTLGLRVQYFQRARMELHPYNQEPYRVQLGLLVDELGYRFPPARSGRIPPFNSALQHHFPETGHVISYAFLDYFREKGGLDIFGYPRSEFQYEDGYVVQYFQRARMEWHPEALSGPRMRLTNLGEIYIERFGIPGNYDDPRPQPARYADSATNPGSAITTLRASASVRHIITGRDGSQTVFVYATDQQEQAVEAATVSMVIHYPSGDRRYDFEPTDANGFTSHTFETQAAPPGRRVVIDVTVSYGDLTSTTQIFFLPWW